MVNIWTVWLLAGTAACVAVVWAVPMARGRGPRAIGLGAWLIPVTALNLWAFGVTIPFTSWAASGPAGDTSNPGGLVFLFGAESQREAFLVGILIVAGAAVITAAAPRQAAYLAAASLVILGLVEAFAATTLNPQFDGSPWYDWLRWSTWPGLVWVVALASVTGGCWLSKRTIVADLRAPWTLTARVQALTETRAERSTRPRPNCAAWNGTCTTAPRPGLSRLASASAPPSA